MSKPLPPNQLIGESWELYDFPPGVVDGSAGWVSSTIANGPLAGRTLHAVMQEFFPALLGDVAPVGPHRQFPLLVKFLDAREDLSVQVHPDAAYARSHPGAHLKTEAWYVLQHDPGSRLFKGLRPGTTPQAFRAAVADGTVEQRLTTLPAADGQCHYLPSGTVHALGAGILCAEVQTPSDTTFRVFDFDRTDPATGKPRALHVEQALACIDFSAEDQTLQSGVPGEALVSSPYFRIEAARLAPGQSRPVPVGRPAVWVMLEGEAVLGSEAAGPVRVARGDTVLLPAFMPALDVRAQGACRWLQVGLPAAP